MYGYGGENGILKKSVELDSGWKSSPCRIIRPADKVSGLTAPKTQMTVSIQKMLQGRKFTEMVKYATELATEGGMSYFEALNKARAAVYGGIKYYNTKHFGEKIFAR